MNTLQKADLTAILRDFQIQQYRLKIPKPHTRSTKKQGEEEHR